MDKPLKIAALDSEDLDVVSSHLQDAIIRLDDIRFLRRQKKFVIVANRFDWLSARGRNTGQRCRCGVTINTVTAARSQKIRQGAGDAVISFLAMRFDAKGEGPEGVITLEFSGGGRVQLDVECIEVQMEDLGPVWKTPNIPSHNLDEE
ncbi:MAG TPA: DUF2948 family protein [Rhizobiales bacterium]|nr:DUF2948 family protein [Hyphomicrobiales bacterium]